MGYGWTAEKSQDENKCKSGIIVNDSIPALDAKSTVLRSFKTKNMKKVNSHQYLTYPILRLHKTFAIESHEGYRLYFNNVNANG